MNKNIALPKRGCNVGRRSKESYSSVSSASDSTKNKRLRCETAFDSPNKLKKAKKRSMENGTKKVNGHQDENEHGHIGKPDSGKTSMV